MAGAWAGRMDRVDILYVFAHPDDESFGPQLAMLRQVDAGHRVHLLCLTRGGASQVGRQQGLTHRELQDLRVQELAAAVGRIGCTSMRLGTFPDGGLHRLDPRIIERPLAATLERLDPRLVVTFPHHGINGHGDHCTTHAAVRRTFCAWRDHAPGPRRLAFIGLEAEAVAGDQRFHPVPDDEVAFRIPVDPALRERAQAALDEHRSQRELVADYRPLDWFDAGLIGTLFGEPVPAEPLADLTTGLSG